MRLFVACTNHSYILTLDGERVTLQHPDRKSNFGYAWEGDSLFAPNASGLVEYNRALEVVAVHQDKPYEGLENPWAMKEPEHVDRSQFNRAHELLTIKGNIFCTDTANEEVRIFNCRERQFLPALHFSDIPYVREQGINWINSVNFIDGKFHFVAHNHGFSSLLLFDEGLHFLGSVENIGFTAHNIWKMQGALWTLCSGTGQVQTVDVTRKINLGGFLRGVALSGEYLFIGVSKIRKSHTLDLLKPGIVRPERPPGALLGADPHLGVAVLDAKSLELIRFIELPDAKAVLSLRLMDERDFAIHVDAGNEIFSL